MNFLPLLQTTAGAGSIMMTVLPLLFIFIIFYFLLIRPQNKKQKELEKMIAALKKGDKVVTIGGIHGVVSSTREQTVIVKVDDNSKIEFNRTAIATVITDKSADVAKSNKKISKAEETAVEAETSSPEENK
ncbi:MAG: preprotein translocase subunit YajC [Spirochaetaceae bacterium]|nr:preprotein translocase subunit YajC [Spirochaetaceae bacterium]